MNFSVLKKTAGILFLFCAASAGASTATVVSVVGKTELRRNNEWVTLEKLTASEKKDAVSVFLNTGAVRFTVNHAENRQVSYTVRNPIAVAGMRGTDFNFFGNAVHCSDDAVAFRSSGDDVQVVYTGAPVLSGARKSSLVIDITLK